tara:strand:+ start:259 stop:1116 length:858 start_codon:yes stop_codon:yes gene_type:complete
MLLWFQPKRVNVNTSLGYVAVVLVRLDKIEVSAHALRETVVTIELELGREDRVETTVLADPLYGVSTGETGGAWVGRGVLVRAAWCDKDDISAIWVRWVTAEWGEIFGISVIEPLLSADGRVKENGILLDNPDKFLTWVIEVELDLVADARDRFVTSELNLLNEVLVRDLGETSALIGVKVDVVNEERSGGEGKTGRAGGSEATIRGGTEFDVNLDLVVLKSNKREGKSGVAAEPELKRDVKIHFWDDRSGRVTGGELGKSGYVTDHVGVTNLLSGFLRKLVPDV